MLIDLLVVITAGEIVFVEKNIGAAFEVMKNSGNAILFIVTYFSQIDQADAPAEII